MIDGRADSNNNDQNKANTSCPVSSEPKTREPHAPESQDLSGPCGRQDYTYPLAQNGTTYPAKPVDMLKYRLRTSALRRKHACIPGLESNIVDYKVQAVLIDPQPPF